ncbi:MAG TPA: hypothetical protein VM186_05030, partial [Planctomycetota bacterium]|nr:hypothetical protein [Planctomycetota bacterium]
MANTRLIVTGIALMLLFSAAPAMGETWTGDGTTDNWSDGDNWGGVAPENPSVNIITFTDTDVVTDTTVNNVVDLADEITDWTIGGLTYTNTASSHNTQIQADKTLIVAGNLNAWLDIGADHSAYSNLFARFTGGTLQIGAEGTPVDISIAHVTGNGWRGIGGTVLVSCTGLKPYIRDAYIGYINRPESDRTMMGYLDLRGTPVIGGTLAFRHLYLGRGTPSGQGRIYLDDATALTNLEIAGNLHMAYEGGSTSIGDPAAANTLPADVNIKIGIDEETRGNLKMGLGGRNPWTSGGFTGTASIVATGGGTFTAYLDALQVGTTAWNFADSVGNGTLDVSMMDSVLLDVSGTATIGESTSENGRYVAAVKLPSGSARVNALRLGVGGLGTRSALLQLNGTTFAVDATATVGAAGTVETTLDGVSCGLSVDDPSAAALAVATGGKIQINFMQDQITPGSVYWGLRWKGNHTSSLNSLISGGKIIVDDSAVPGKLAGVVYDAGTDYTCVTLAESWPLTAVPR